MLIYSIVLASIVLSESLCEWVGLSQSEHLLSTTIMDYWHLHQEMGFVGALGDLIASIIFCRKNLIKLRFDILKIIRFPRRISEIPKDIKLFCVMVGPCFAFSIFKQIFFPTWSLSYLSIYWWIVPSTIASIIVPLILIKCDKLPADKTEITEKEAKTIGLIQLLSFLPGIGSFDTIIGAMRFLGYTCLQAFRCYILVSIPFGILTCINCIPLIVQDILWQGEINLSLCAAVLIISSACEYLILRLVELFWSKVSLTTWSIFCMITGILGMSYKACFVFKHEEVVRLLSPFFGC